MERTIQVEDRIRRAEEIYNNRRMQNSVRVSTKPEKMIRKYSFAKKLVIQIIACLLIYFVFYSMKNSNYIYSENILAKAKEFLSYDINFEEIYLNAEKYYKERVKIIFESEDKINEINEENKTNEVIEESNEVTEEQSADIDFNEIGIGGGEDEQIEEILEKEVSADEEEAVELSQMEQDALDIKNNYSLIVPLDGIISSRFGPRTPTGIVSANHAGIDIAVNEGTVFVASMEGTVTYVSDEGGYGKHFWIQKDDVITLYAHCSNIYVNEGDEIEQGQAIGEVGQTGNATGPHLHFEIRKDDRVVNPELVLDFE